MNTKKILGIAALTLLVAMAFVGAAAAANPTIGYAYVSPDGTADYPGNSTTDCCSIATFLAAYNIDTTYCVEGKTHYIYFDDVTLESGKNLVLKTGATISGTLTNSGGEKGGITVKTPEQLKYVLENIGGHVYIPYVAAKTFSLTETINVKKTATIEGLSDGTNVPTINLKGKFTTEGPMFDVGDTNLSTSITVQFKNLNLVGNDATTSLTPYNDVIYLQKGPVELTIDNCTLDGGNYVIYDKKSESTSRANEKITINKSTLTAHADGKTVTSPRIIGLYNDDVEVNLTDATKLAIAGDLSEITAATTIGGIYVAIGMKDNVVTLGNDVTFDLSGLNMSDTYVTTFYRYYVGESTTYPNETNEINVSGTKSFIALLTQDDKKITNLTIIPVGNAIVNLDGTVSLASTEGKEIAIYLPSNSLLDLNDKDLTIGAYSTLTMGYANTTSVSASPLKGDSLLYVDGGTLTVAKGGTLVNYGTIINGAYNTTTGTLVEDGIINVSGTITSFVTPLTRGYLGTIVQSDELNVNGGEILYNNLYLPVVLNGNCKVDVDVEEDSERREPTVTSFSDVTTFYIANGAFIQRDKDNENQFIVSDCFVYDDITETGKEGQGTFTIVPQEESVSGNYEYHVKVTADGTTTEVGTSTYRFNLLTKKTYTVEVTAEALDVTSDTVFFYELKTAGADKKLTPGYTYVDNDGHSFVVPPKSYDNWYLEPSEKTPEGTYYHKVVASETYPQGYDQIIYVKQATTSYINVENSVIYYDGSEDDPSSTDIIVSNDANFTPLLVFEKVGSEGVYQTFDSDGYVDEPVDYSDYLENGKITVTATAAMKGTWNVYADFSRNLAYNKTLKYYYADDEKLSDKATTDVKYSLIGTLKIVKDKDDLEATLTSEKTEVTDGNTFSIVVNADYTKDTRDEATNFVTVKYYKDGKTSNDAEYVYVEEAGYTDDDPFVFVSGQANEYDEGYLTQNYRYTIPATETLTLGIKTNTRLLKDQVYHFEVYVSKCGSDKKGGVDNPLTFDITVKGNTFTAQLDAKEYPLGTDIVVSGTYSGEDFQPYFYVEGTNTKFFAPILAWDKNNSSKVKDGSYYFTLAGDNFKDLNPGTYTVYVSQLKCYKDYIANASDMETRWKETGHKGAQYDITDGTLTADNNSKAKVIEDAKVLTLILTKPVIEITDVTKEVESGFNSSTNKGKYVTINVTAEGAEDISLYLVGQNKVFYIDGEEAKASHFIKNLDSKDLDNYLFGGQDDDPTQADYNPYYYDDIADEKSVTKVAQKLGLGDGFVGTEKSTVAEYPLYLILDNLDGTFTIYVHLQGADDYKWRIANGNIVEKYNNTYFDNGQYYVVLQHPMADKVYNVWAGVNINDTNGGGDVTDYINWMKDNYGTGYGGKVPTGLTTGKYTVYYNEDDNTWYAHSSNYTTQASILSISGFEFNIPAVKNNEAATKLMNLINEKEDASAGKDFWIVPTANASENISTPNSTYSQGDTITITVKDSEYNLVEGTLEANTFDLTAANVNYIQSFVVKKDDDEDSTNFTLTLDTTQVPTGDYNIVLKGKDANDTTSSIIKVYEVKVVAGKVTPVTEPTLNLTGSTAVKVGKTIALTAKMSDNSAGKFTWKSSDASVASVDENGTVTGLKEGTATITVTNTVNNLTAKKEITVSKESSTGGDTPVTPTPQSPGFGILAALAGLGAVAALVLRRK